MRLKATMNYIALEFDDSRIRVAAARLVAKRVRLQHALLKTELNRDYTRPSLQETHVFLDFVNHKR